MKKPFTFLMMLFAAFLLVGINPATAQTEVWNQAHTWNTGTYYRGIAYNVMNNHLYVAGLEGSYVGDPAGTTVDANKIQILDAATGNVLSTISPASAMGADWGWGIRDVEVDMDGGIYASIATTNQFNPVQLYYWESETAEPELLWKDESGTADDFGSGFSVYGSLNEDALIMIPFTNIAKIYYNEIVDGEGTGVQVLDLTGITHGKTPCVTACGTKISDGFWYNDVSLAGPVKFDGTGNIVASLPAEVFTTSLNGDVKPFSAGGKDYLVVSDGGKVVTVDITGKAADLSDVTAADVVASVDGTLATDGSGWPSVLGPGQEQAVISSPAGDFAIYSLSGGSYVKALSDEAAPMASSAMILGSPVADEVISVAYQYIDFNGDAEGSSEIKWFMADDNMSAGTEIVANSGNTTYTLDAADAGKYIYFSLMPVAASGTVSDAANTIMSAHFGPILAEETAPVAANAAITGINIVGETLTATYDFSDAGGDLEGESILMWYRADDADGSNAVEVASESLTYITTGEDDAKFILFVVTPVSLTGWPLMGESDTAATAEAILFPPMPPSAEDLAIAGREDVAAVLEGSYTFVDLNGDDEAGSILKWYRADNAEGDNSVMVAEATDTYTVDAMDEGKVIIFEVTPISVPTAGHDTGLVVNVATDTIQAEPIEYAPRAKDVTLTAVPEVGVLMSGAYVYEDTIVGDPEGESIYKWYVADDAAGTNATLIDGADKQTYIVNESQIGKHFIFEITPVAQSGGLLQGDPVQSAPTASAAVASTQTFGLERLWNGSVTNGASPWYLDHAVTKERGMAVGDEHIYIASRDRVMIVDKEDGSYVGDLDMEGIEGGIYALADVEVSDDGQILGVPLIDGTDFWVYKWADELSKPEKWLTVSPGEGRFGDKFTVTGDLSAEAVIYAARNGSNILYRWMVTGGIAGDAEEIVLANVTSLETAPAVAPFSVDADANFLIDAKGIAPMVFDKDGNILGTVEMVDNYAAYKIQSNSPNVFQYKGRTMAAFFQAMRQEPLGARIIVADITAPPYQIVDTTEYISNSMSWDGYLGEVDVTTDGEFYYAYMLQAKHALAAYKGTLELPEFTSAITSFEGDKVFAYFDKAMADIELTDAEPWTIMAGETSLVIDSIYNNEEGVSFDLATAIAEGDVVSIAYDGTGTIASFNGLPLGAFGPEAVENIVGSEVPVATDVVVTGNAQPDEVLTGTYVFTDPDGDLEGESKYQWYESTDAAGTSPLKLLGESSLTYTVTADMTGKFVAFEVIPVSATGGADYLVGEPALSAFVAVRGVGIETDHAAVVDVYPNPFTSVLTVENCASFEAITVIDITGREQQQVKTLGESSVELNMEGFQNGVYFLKLSGAEGQSEILRVVKAQ